MLSVISDERQTSGTMSLYLPASLVLHVFPPLMILKCSGCHSITSVLDIFTTPGAKPLAVTIRGEALFERKTKIRECIERSWRGESEGDSYNTLCTGLRGHIEVNLPSLPSFERLLCTYTSSFKCPPNSDNDLIALFTIAKVLQSLSSLKHLTLMICLQFTGLSNETQLLTLHVWHLGFCKREGI